MKTWPKDKSAKEILDDLYATMEDIVANSKSKYAPDLRYYPEWMYTRLMPPPTLEETNND